LRCYAKWQTHARREGGSDDTARNARSSSADQHIAAVWALPGSQSARDIVQRILSPMTAAVTGYRDELNRMLDAGAVYLGPGR
jgi:hypothetical protein